MSDQLHSIRFKREGVEFELTGTQADVQKVWTALESSVVSTFGHAAAGRHQPPSDEPDGDGEPPDGEEAQAKPRKRRSRRSTGGVKNADGRADVVTKLLNIDF